MLEVGLIVVGVILGLTVDNLRQAAADRARAREVLELIATELADNRARLASRAYHETIGDSLGALAGRALGNQPISFGDMDRAMPEGMAPVLLSSTAWELAKASEALRHLDLRVLTAVSTAYERQAFLQGKHDQAGANFYQGSTRTRTSSGATSPPCATWSATWCSPSATCWSTTSRAPWKPSRAGASGRARPPPGKHWTRPRFIAITVR